MRWEGGLHFKKFLGFQLCCLSNPLLSSRRTAHAREDILLSCQQMLKELQLDYIDLYLYLHWPMTNAVDLSKVTEDEMVGYNPQSAAETWEVRARVKIGR